MADFSFKGEVSVAGRELAEFEYRVPVSHSHYFFSGGRTRVATGYSGTIRVDPKSAELVELVVQTDGLPPETGACESRTSLNYTRIRLNDSDFLLPRRVQLRILNSDGIELDNTTVYSNCHEFLGESKLQFDDPMEPGAAARDGAASAAHTELPEGLMFTVALSEGVSPATAAAGDKLAARLTSPIKDAKGTTLIREGAAVTARIMQIRRFYLSQPMVRLVIKLESIDVGGTIRPLSARSEFWPPAMKQMKTGLGRRFDPATRDNMDPAAAVFEIRDPRDSQIPAFESRWSVKRVISNQ
jgi:hypothetical protein